MKIIAPTHVFAVFCCLFIPLTALPQTGSVKVAVALPAADTFTDDPVNFVPNDMSIPGEMLDLMRISHLRYQEGSRLLKGGESARAREAFNAAVEMILKSEWDLAAEPVLGRYFQDLIHRIQRDESRYLQPDNEREDVAETAVVDELEKVDLIPITVEPALRDTAEADLADTQYDIPVELNETVLKSLNYWLTKGKVIFSDGLVRSGRYRDMISKTFREESVPLDVMYLAQVESLFKTNALSRRACKGIWQFGKGTAIRYGLKVDRHVDERSDPEKSTRAAARYLNDLYAMFQDWNLVLAAYNWGEGRVLKLVNRSGVNDFWDLMELRRNFPAETRNHVPLIMASIILGRNPEKYGLPTELDPPLAYDRVSVSRPVDLRVVAKTLDVPVDALKELNPSLRGQSTPFGYPNFELKVPEGMGSRLEQRLASLPAAKPERERPSFTDRHRVRPGETMSKIAAQYRVSVAALQKANGIVSPGSLRAGIWLTVPAPHGAATRAASGRSKTPAAKSRSTRPLEQASR
jgi:peptidoglycan lytic transglycosylase D